MAKAQKFGTFGGVFVPSLLTILGVIMYLRLGWVVGEAGLIGAIMIILIAHVISVSTGLSVSSISTDKKVKAGGIYYILSRSLGLPIGGSIGIALFVATALSIAMYIVGFGESFNNALGLTTPDMELAERINYLRITGTITLTALAAIAMISTSLAIKAQYYILGAIVLSLISILAGGLFIDHGFTPQTVKIFPSTGSVSMEIVFAIFFPAVTGFTAGVAMSGDLKDPKKSIPVGTLAAIAVGLVVYLGLAVFLAITIESEILVNDTNVLSRIALFAAYGAPFLLAGIWGATLSSALGGILGGPRILQAMSVDKVTPGLFGKGVGKSNEPRNALIFTFVIAEIGVLIGQLDLIAPIVSMFYLTAYGFINLTSALQSWSGSEFRPSFRIPRIVSVIGAAATFAVMFKLNATAMVTSFIVIAFIFSYLTKKQIKLGFSDIWQGVWSEIVRTALFKIEKESIDKRNWRPNILLFSGGTEKRPHLVEYGKKLVGKLGLLSNFDLIEDKNSTVLFTKDEQAINTPEESKGVFTRRYHCNNIYTGIARIAETYGFSGLEPNTVIMGWARYSRTPKEFIGLINVFKQLDFNLLIMDYDQRLGFGNKKLIDIWWHGEGRHASFALTISRFLNTSDDWRDASVRLIILAHTSEADHMVINKKMEHVLEELRISPKIKIINTALDHRSYYDIIQGESAQADLIYLELPRFQSDDEQEFFDKTDALCHEIGTVVLYRASRNFDNIDLGLGAAQQVSEEVKTLIPDPVPFPALPELVLPKQPVLAEKIQNLDDLSRRLIADYFDHSLAPALSKFSQLINKMDHSTRKIYLELANEPNKTLLKKKKEELQQNTQNLLEDFRDKEVQRQEQILAGGHENIFTDIDLTAEGCSPNLLAEYNLDALLQNGHDKLKKFAWWQKARNKITHTPLRYNVRYKKIVELHLKQTLPNAIEALITSINKDGAHFITQWQNHSKKAFEILHSWEEQLKHGGNSDNSVILEHHKMHERFEGWFAENKRNLAAYQNYLLAVNYKSLQEIAASLEDLSINGHLKLQLRPQKIWKRTRLRILAGTTAGRNNQSLFFNIPLLELKLKGVQEKITAEIQVLVDHLHEWREEGTPKEMDRLILYFEKLRVDILKGKSPTINVAINPYNFTLYQELVEALTLQLKELPNQVPEELEVANLLEIDSNPLEEMEAITISPAGVMNFVLQNDVDSPLLENTEKLKTALEKTEKVIRGVIRVISFSVNNLETETQTEGAHYREHLLESIDEEIVRLRNESEKFIRILDGEANSLMETVKYLLPKLDAFAFIKSAVDLAALLRSQQKSEVINSFSRITRGVKERFQNNITKLYYRKSEGLLAAERFRSLGKEGPARTEDIIRLVENSTPLQSVLETLPIYYKQLFLKNHSVNSELWLQRAKDLQDTKNAISDYNKLKSGAVLITGEPGSGKSFLSEFIARSYSHVGQIQYVNPPASGSIDIKLFVQTVKKALHYYGDIELAFNGLAKDAVIIFNDLELWWERSENGMQVIEAIIDIINRFGSRCFFIANMNNFTFDLVNNIKRIDDAFIRIINIKPFSAEELKEVITKRHQTSRLKYVLDGTEEEGLSNFRKAKLFNLYFNTSGGNVGVALQSWISNIREVQDNQIEIRRPEQLNRGILHYLEKDRVVILLQFLLHRRLNRSRLHRIMGEDTAQLDKEIQGLLRSGILQEKNEVLELNRFLRPLLIDTLVEDQLI